MEQKTEASQAVKFRKKPVEIEAIQWTGKLSCLDAFNIPELHQSLGSDKVGIPTLEGTMIAHVGDWIIKGVKGEFYPCKNDIFELTYERAALKAQPAPTEAQSEPVMWFEAEASAKGKTLRYVLRNSMLYSTRTHMTKPEVLNNALWPLYEQPAPTEAAQGAQPSGNPGELVQGWDVDDLINDMDINEEVAGMRAELQANSTIIPSILAAQGEDSARLDAIEKDGYSIGCLWKNTGFAGPAGMEWHVWIYGTGGAICGNGKTVREAIDRARASAETGGVKS